MRKALTTIIALVSLHSAAQCPDSVAMSNGNIEFYFYSALRQSPSYITIEYGSNVYRFDSVSQSTQSSYTMYSVADTFGLSASQTYDMLKFFAVNQNNKPYIVAICSKGALPVDLVKFEGKLIGNHIALEWATASEVNSSHFVLQKYADGWLDIATIKTSGNSNNIERYAFNDFGVIDGYNIYRLIHWDYDGSYQVHKAISVKCALNAKLDPLNGYDIIGRQIN